MTPHDFFKKWRNVELKERTAFHQAVADAYGWAATGTMA